MTRRAVPRGPRPPALVVLAAVAAGGLTAPPEVGAQVDLRSLVVTGGLSTEGYQGNLPTIAAVVRDSTEFASAVIGEFGLRGEVVVPTGDRAQAMLAFDGGLRQFSARGFELRDYAPREWAGRTDLEYLVSLGRAGAVAARARVRGREVKDRPPMPLFLQPGYRALGTGLAGEFPGPAGWRWDVDVGGEWSDFLAPSYAPQIRLLDRRSARAEVGIRPAWEVPGAFRLHAGAELTRFPRQETFAPDDPYRRDRTFQAGVSWTWQGDFLAQIAADGQVNRSNSRRPEYDAATVRGLVSTSLPGGIAATGYLALTGKRYRTTTEFARLLPGEEANSASQAYLSFTRGFARNLDGSVRLGWTRAETEIGGQYFQRYGGSFLLSYRPTL